MLPTHFKEFLLPPFIILPVKMIMQRCGHSEMCKSVFILQNFQV